MRSKKNKRGQIVSFDLVTSLIIFVLFLAVFIGFFFFQQNKDLDEGEDFEVEFIFDNLENNLKLNPSGPTLPVDFFGNYRVKNSKLVNFIADIDETKLDDYIIGNLANTHGIGLDTSSFDTCLFFRDENGIIDLNPLGTARKAIGKMKDSESCHDKLDSGENPCEGYDNAIALFKPVLFDRSDSNLNKIVQMNILLCKN
jgi:hypothetical protein